MKEKREARNKSTQIESINFDKVLRTENGKRITSSINGTGKTGYLNED